MPPDSCVEPQAPLQQHEAGSQGGDEGQMRSGAWEPCDGMSIFIQSPEKLLPALLSATGGQDETAAI